MIYIDPARYLGGGGELTLPLAGEGWGGGASHATDAEWIEFPPPAALLRAPQPKLSFGVLI